jgi:uncharacterized protein YkwD
MKRLSLLTLTIMLGMGCQRSEANPMDITQPNAIGNEESNFTRLTTCYDADEWTCAVEAAIVRKTNEKRSGLAGLDQVFETSHVARGHSKYMVEFGISHDNFQARAAELKDALPDMEINALGENVAQMSQNMADPELIAAEFVRMWWNSKGHRDNMLNGRYHYIGVGIMRSGNAIYATQMFH